MVGTKYNDKEKLGSLPEYHFLDVGNGRYQLTTGC